MIPLLVGKAAGGPLARLIVLSVIAGAVLFVAPDLLNVALDAAGGVTDTVINAVLGAIKGVIEWFAGLVAENLNPF